jgi:hypothetical protein
MKVNLWIYSDKTEQLKTSASLIAFGAEIFKRAKVIKDLDQLKQIKHDIDKNIIHPKDIDIAEFAFEFLVDCIRFLIFFENYMKAELILKDYCVHEIDQNRQGFATLAKEQRKRPIKLKEINDIEKFTVDTVNKVITHDAIKDKTIGMTELLGTKKYSIIYGLDPELIKLIKAFNTLRNKLHFHTTLEFQLTDTFFSNLDILNQFVDKEMKDKFRK